MGIEKNQVVSIEYKAVDTANGEIVDSNIGGHPLEFIVGFNQIIPGLENAIMALNVGDKSDVIVKPADAYGEYNHEAIDVLPKEQFAGIDLFEGMTLYGQGESGETIPVVVKSFDADNVTIDFNHPMAGKELMFSVTILEVRYATPEETATGHVAHHHHGGSSCGTGGGSCGCH